MSERMKFEVKKRTTYEGRRWNPGDIVEVYVDETEEYPLKGMIEAGIVEKIEVDEEVEREVLLDGDELVNIDGIGPSYAEDLMEKYETEEELLEADDEEIAEVHGITPELAEKVKDELR